MKFKKIMSVIAGAAMLSTTVAFAAASGGSIGVLGDNTVINAPGSADASARTSITDYINSLNIGKTTDNETFINGEMEAIKTSSQPLYLGDYMNSTKSTFTETQLPNVLASGEVDGDDGKDYEYNLKIDVPNSITEYGEPEDSTDEAIVYADFSGNQYYKLRIIFPTAVDVKELAGEDITLFGRDFTFSEDEDDLDNTSVTLFEKSNSVIVNSGETKIVEGHEIRVDIEDTNSATIYVDGISKNVDDEDWSGKIGGVSIYIKNIHAPNVEGYNRYVELSLNSEQLTLSDGDEVERGTSDIDGTNVEIKTSDEKVREIAITVTPNDIEDIDDDNVEYLGIGDYLIDPVFKTIKFSFDSVTPDLKSEDRDYIKVKAAGNDDAVLEFTNKAGKEYNFEFIKNDEFQLFNPTVVEEAYFITRSNEYTQIWEVEDIDEDSIRVRDQGEDSDYLDLTIDNNIAKLPLADGGEMDLTVNTNRLSITRPAMDAQILYTEKGAMIEFVIEGVEFTGISITEDTDYNGGTFTDNAGEALGTEINISITYNDPVSLSLGDVAYTYTDDNDEYALTKYGTFVKAHEDERVELYYPEEAMSLDFYIGGVESSITSEPVVTEGKVSQVIIGGSAINSEAARLLGGNYHGEEFTAVTGVGAGQAMIQVFADTDDKVAILVAGYDAADTARAVQYLIDNEGYIDLTIGSKILV